MAANAAVDAKTNDGGTPLHVAVDNGHTAAVTALVLFLFFRIPFASVFKLENRCPSLKGLLVSVWQNNDKIWSFAASFVVCNDREALAGLKYKLCRGKIRECF